MADLTHVGESLVAKFLLAAHAATRPTEWFVQLHTADPGEDGTTSPVSGSGFARQEFIPGAESGGEVVNDGVITFPVASGGSWGNVTHVSLWDAVTSGNCLMKGDLTASKQIDEGDQLVFDSGELKFAFA